MKTRLVLLGILFCSHFSPAQELKPLGTNLCHLTLGAVSITGPAGSPTNLLLSLKTAPKMLGFERQKQETNDWGKIPDIRLTVPEKTFMPHLHYEHVEWRKDSEGGADIFGGIVMHFHQGHLKLIVPYCRDDAPSRKRERFFAGVGLIYEW